MTIKKALTLALLCGTFVCQAPIGMAATAVPVGRIDLGPGVMLAIRATPDGKRAVVVVNNHSKVSVVNVLDTQTPQTPHLDGHVEVDTGAFNEGSFVQAALSPDGRSVLLSNVNRAIGPNKAVVTLIDVADSKTPKVLWQRQTEALGSIVALANNASAYAVAVREDDSKGDAHFRTLITNVSEPARSIQLDNLGNGALNLSDKAAFLTWYDGSNLIAIDLRTPNSATYVEDLFAEFAQEHPEDEDANSFSSKYGCEIARDDGLIVAAESTMKGPVDILGTTNSKLSKLSAPILGFDGSRVCDAFNRNDSERDIIFWDDAGMIVRMDLRDPKHPTKDGYWRVSGSATSAVAAGMLFGEVAGPNVLQISKLEWSDRSPVDWQKLDAIYTKATQQPAGASAGADANSTIDAFEAGGIFNAISADVTGVTRQRAALILRYYATLLGGTASTIATPREVSTAALRRSVELDPR